LLLDVVVDATRCPRVADTSRLRIWFSPLLGVAMKNQTIVFDDDLGHSLIIYRIGIFAWSYSVNGKPAGKTFLTRGRAIRAVKKAGYFVTVGVKK
jgi:hypothetical protein